MYNIGDVVALKSGGRSMTVTCRSHSGNFIPTGYVQVQWMNDEGKMQWDNLPEEALTLRRDSK